MWGEEASPHTSVSSFFKQPLSIDADHTSIFGNTISNNNRGIFLQANEAAIRGNTISSNSGRGMYLWQADVNVFENNVVEFNSGDGIYAFSSSSLYAGGEARNVIRDNGGDEIQRGDGTSSLSLGSASYDGGGYNDIYDNSYGSGNYFVSAGNLTTKAENNYWGEEAPRSSMFSGSVDYSPSLGSSATEDVTASVFCTLGSDPEVYNCSAYAQNGSEYDYDWNQSGCDGSSTCEVSCETYVSVTVTSADGEQASASTYSGQCFGGGGCGGRLVCGPTTTHSSTPYETLDASALDEEITGVALSAQAEEGSADEQAARLHELYDLLLLRARVEEIREGGEGVVFADSRSSMKQTFTSQVQTLVSTGAPNDLSSPGRWTTERRERQLAGEASMLILVEDLLRTGKQTEALAQAKSYAPFVVSTENQRSLWLLKAAAYEQEGNYAAALKAVTQAQRLDADADPSSYRPVEEWLRSRVPGKSAKSARAVSTEASSLLLGEAEGSGLPEIFEMGAPYPNPSDGRFTLPLSLPEQARVRAEVYDVLGRRVAFAADRSFGAGHHKVAFETDDLTSAMYLIRVEVRTASGKEHVATEEVTLIR